jgi:hypothetical protein
MTTLGEQPGGARTRTVELIIRVELAAQEDVPLKGSKSEYKSWGERKTVELQNAQHEICKMIEKLGMGDEFISACAVNLKQPPLLPTAPPTL